MNIKNHPTIDLFDDFIQRTQAVAFSLAGDKQERYQLVQRTLIKFNYGTLSKALKGIIIQLLMKVTQYPSQQITPLIQSGPTYHLFQYN